MSDRLQIVYAYLDQLIPYARNSRTHSDEQVAQIAASIREFGFTNPILVDAEGGIIAGHGRVLAARKIGMATVPTICLGNLSETQRRAYVIADNKLALNAGWDEETLRVELVTLHGDGYEMELLGFSADELAIAMGLAAQDLEPKTQDQQSKVNGLTICPSCGHEFDL